MKTNRRTFLKSEGSLAFFMVVPRNVLGRGYVAPSDQLTKGIIGVGNMGCGHISYDGTRVVDMCDVDKKYLSQGAALVKDKINLYGDFRSLILDNDAPIYANLKPYQYHGSVYGIIPSKRGYLKPNGEWNYQEVIAKGDNIKITLNGTVILDGNIREATKENGPADHKEHPGLFNEKGHIGFLGHGSVVKFKEIRIKRLK